MDMTWEFLNLKNMPLVKIIPKCKKVGFHGETDPAFLRLLICKLKMVYGMNLNSHIGVCTGSSAL